MLALAGIIGWKVWYSLVCTVNAYNLSTELEKFEASWPSVKLLEFLSTFGSKGAHNTRYCMSDTSLNPIKVAFVFQSIDL